MTPRQHEVLVRITQGMTNQEIANDLGLSVNSVKTHAKGLFKALGAHTRIEAAVIGLDSEQVNLSKENRQGLLKLGAAIKQSLFPKERQLLPEFAAGREWKEVAARLGKKPNTVRIQGYQSRRRLEKLRGTRPNRFQMTLAAHLSKIGYNEHQ